MTGKAPAFQLYASDFYIDTNSWTVDEVGIYTRLLLSQWVNGGLPNDIRRLARVAGCNLNRFKKAWSQVQVKFHLNGKGIYINDRLENEREKQLKFKELQSDKGKKSAIKRWGEPVTTDITDPLPALQPDCNSSVFSLQSSINKKDKDIYGEFQNVLLLEDELKKLIEAFGDQDTKEKIENLSQYIASKGKKYSSHYATILSWERKNPKKIDMVPTDPMDKRMWDIEQARKRRKDGRTEPTS